MLSGRIRPYHSASPEVVCFRVRAPWRARRRGPWPLLSSRSRRLGPGPVIGWLCSLLCTHRVVMSVSPLSENDWHEPRKAAHLTTHQDGARIQGYARTPTITNRAAGPGADAPAAGSFWRIHHGWPRPSTARCGATRHRGRAAPPGGLRPPAGHAPRIGSVRGQAPRVGTLHRCACTGRISQRKASHALGARHAVMGQRAVVGQYGVVR